MHVLKTDPFLDLAGDLDSILTEERPEVTIEALSLLLAKYIGKCQNPEISALQATKILVNILR